MAAVISKVAVIGSGISGAVCASILAKNGIRVTIFDSGRGPGGRMSQRREIAEDGRDLSFDHGAPYFSLTAGNSEVQSVVDDWVSRGIVAEWKDKFGCFDFVSKQFVSNGEEGVSKKYVGVPGMNSICRALCNEPGMSVMLEVSVSQFTLSVSFSCVGVESRFGLGIGHTDWSEDDALWSLTSLDGQDVGRFNGVVASDKNTYSPRFATATGKTPPIDINMVNDIALQTKEIPVSPCFALMLAFEQPLSSVPKKGFSFKNSNLLSRAFCESSKPGRSTSSERWVLHSTPEYAAAIISQTGLQKPSGALLTKVADDLFQEFQSTGLDISLPFFKKAHRWGSAFPAASIAGEEKCMWVEKKRLAICGDFCVSPSVEGAITSGIAAAAKFVRLHSTM